MHTVSIAEVKAHLSKLLNYVIAGNSVVITRRGRPIARIESIAPSPKPVARLVNFRSQFPKVKTPSVELLRKLRDENY
jgi:prevent-host-death family protein